MPQRAETCQDRSTGSRGLCDGAGTALEPTPPAGEVGGIDLAPRPQVTASQHKRAADVYAKDEVRGLAATTTVWSIRLLRDLDKQHTQREEGGGGGREGRREGGRQRESARERGNMYMPE